MNENDQKVLDAIKYLEGNDRYGTTASMIHWHLLRTDETWTKDKVRHALTRLEKAHLILGAMDPERSKTAKFWYAEPVCISSTHTDLMVTPEAIDEALLATPYVQMSKEDMNKLEEEQKERERFERQKQTVVYNAALTGLDLERYLATQRPMHFNSITQPHTYKNPAKLARRLSRRKK